ncbi:MAG TPA: DegT/DnrJ/EryC1/StrS family aminotransferase [Deltaproteobacteria bacterium]|nr:DegT/DnrJ/EryC1/StrS family aminotransferase [Deltaproteobacteria bacterium]
MKIPFYDFSREQSCIGDDVRCAIDRVLASDRFILGNELELFEKEFARICSCRYAVGVASGTDALFLALKAMGTGPGDEVITVSHSFAATALAILYTGATPVFVDIEDNSYHMDPDLLEKAITPKTKAIIPVHLYGACAPMSAIKEIAEKHRVYVLEDACQAHGALYRVNPAGSLGDAAAFSFYPTKNLGAYGDAGMITTNDAELYEKLLLLRNYGQRNRYHYEMVGYNSRLDEMQAAVLRAKLTRLAQWTGKRQEIASKYVSGIGNIDLLGLNLEMGSTHVYYLYVIAVKDRDGLMAHLSERGIQTLIHYPVPIHLHNPFKDAKIIGKLRNTETRASQILSIPMHPFLHDDEIGWIVDSVKGYYA